MTTTNLALEDEPLGYFGTQQAVADGFRKIDAAVGRVLTGSAVFNPPSLADGAGTNTTVTVTGAALGDFVDAVSFSVDLAGVTLTGYVSAANTVTARLQNESGGSVDLAEGTLRVRVRKA